MIYPLLFLLPLLAQEKVIVTGYRDAPKSALEIVEGEALGEDVPQSLELTPGVEINESPKRGAYIQLRGFSARGNRILFDGIPIQEVFSGQINLSSLLLLGSERLEVDKGLTSVLYGPDSMGGVIQIHSRRPQRGLHGQGELSGADLYKGQLLSKGGRVQLSHREGALSLRLGFAHRLSDGYLLSREWREDELRAEFHEDGGIRENSDAQRSSLAADLEYRLRPGLRLKLLLQGFHEERGIPTMESASYLRRWRFSEYDNDLQGLSLRWLPEEGGDWSFLGLEAVAWRSAHQDTLEDCGDPECQNLTQDPQAWFVQSSYDNQILGASLHPSFSLWEHNELDLGFQYEQRESRQREIPVKTEEVNERWGPWDLYSAQIFNAALEDTQHMGPWRLGLGLGLSALKLLAEEQREREYPVEDRLIQALDGRLFLDRRLGDQARLILAFGHKTRYPSLKELYSNAVGGNSALEPERAWMSELGLDWKGKVLGFKARIYYNSLSDLIEREREAYANLDEATLAGAELELRAHWSLLSAGLSYQYLHAWDERREQPLELRSPHGLGAQLLLSSEQGSLSLKGIWRSGQRSIWYDPSLNAWRDDPIPSYLLIHLQGRFKWTKSCYSFFHLKNLMDRDYQRGGFAPQPGRSLSMGLGAGF